MEEREVIKKIESLCKERGWSLYRLAKESGVTYSTLCMMLRRTNAPSIYTLSRICNGFGITLSQFFGPEPAVFPLSEGQKALLDRWERLSPEDQRALEKYWDYLLSKDS